MRIPFLVSRSGLTQMGHAIASKGRHHHARPRERQALPRVTGKERLLKTASQPTEIA